jgi:2-methylcitrate dehydratase PrpD
VAYPGCNYAGPFERILQAKMSIQYCVAATLAQSKLGESNYHLLNDPEVTRLIGMMTLEAGDDFTSNYPAHQGAEVIVRLRNGEIHKGRLNDVVPATPGEIRARFRAAASQNAKAIENFIDDLEHQEDAGALGRLLEKD